jgi:hypothetical protein
MKRLFSRVLKKFTRWTVEVESDQASDFTHIYRKNGSQKIVERPKSTKLSTKLSTRQTYPVEDIINNFNESLDKLHNLGNDGDCNQPRKFELVTANILDHGQSEVLENNTNYTLLSSKNSYIRIKGIPLQSHSQSPLIKLSDITKSSNNLNQHKLLVPPTTKISKTGVIVQDGNNFSFTDDFTRVPSVSTPAFVYISNVWNTVKKVYQGTKFQFNRYQESNQLQTYDEYFREYDDDCPSLIQYRNKYLFTTIPRNFPQKPTYPVFKDRFHSLYVGTGPNKYVNRDRIPILDRLYERIDNIPPKGYKARTTTESKPNIKTRTTTETKQILKQKHNDNHCH